MNAVQDLLTSLPLARTVLDIILLAVPPAALSAFSGLGLFCAAMRLQGARRRRSSFDKCARQMTVLSLILGWTLLAGSRLWLYFLPAEGEAAPLGTVHEISWVLLALAVLFSSLSLAAWRPLGRVPALHVALELCQSACGHMAFLVAMAAAPLAPIVASLSSSPAPSEIVDALALANFLPLSTPFFCSFILLFAMPASFGACWLLLRRTHDDYGRDHYVVMLRWCAGWARTAWLALWVLLVVLEAARIFGGQDAVFTARDALERSLFLLLWLVPALLWVAARAGTAPLRHKAGLTLAMLLSVAFFLPLSLETLSPLPNDVAFLPEKDAVIVPAPDLEPSARSEAVEAAAPTAPAASVGIAVAPEAHPASEEASSAASVAPDATALSEASSAEGAGASPVAEASVEAGTPPPASPSASAVPDAVATPEAASADAASSAIPPSVAAGAVAGAAAVTAASESEARKAHPAKIERKPASASRRAASNRSSSRKAEKSGKASSRKERKRGSRK